MCILFHLRGSMLTKIKKSVTKPYLDIIESWETKYSLKSTGLGDKRALTLPRISMLTPGISMIVAIALGKIQMFTQFTTQFSIFGANCLPALLAYKTDEEKRKLYWKIYLVLNTQMAGVIPSSIKETATERMKKSHAYAIISFNNGDESLEMVAAVAKYLISYML